MKTGRSFQVLQFFLGVPYQEILMIGGLHQYDGSRGAGIVLKLHRDAAPPV